MSDSARWAPKYVCRAEIANVVRSLVEHMQAAKLIHCVEQEKEDPDVFVLMCHDAGGYINIALIGWDVRDGCVRCYAVDGEVTRHNFNEGLDADDAMRYWETGSTEMTRKHLVGEVREIMASIREKLWAAGKSEDGGADNGADSEDKAAA